ncbi:hypothetical protein P8B55_004192 [Salmonella enterica]|uniref:hypothetical protein n=1 Tax=Salmonella enterica TaxID=28901 RepID=UPI00191C736A|nr:hypothetical protein [Salmonella enterica]EHX8438523.1 hypothetical protein [Salmonella enterica subsp. enterica serovar Malstatt]EIC3053830.1 hypothetical protein [Salmonella enterica subsp. enterica serovar Virchow]EIC3370545.1 hypothetical protein [Salmonella enterica subsp. enterica serovar Virchow]EJW7743676.1 hypothetical protein [Salmonella enterica]EKR2829640.1 hypothetical protein [Salmonella enterica]
MTIDKQTLCIENAFDIENQLYELANNEIECDSFAVTSTNENGTEIEFERPITDLALEAASTINALLKRLESKEKLVADLASQLDAQLARSNALAAENAHARERHVFIRALAVSILEHSGGRMDWRGAMEDATELLQTVDSVYAKTPATDVFLAEVRAQGVERYAAQLKSEAELADETGWDGAAKFLISESEKVLAFAAQLRQEAAK